MKVCKAFSIILGMLLAVLLAGCSQVFEAGISGKVVTRNGTNKVGVSNVNVFTYTDKGLRDSDFEMFKDGTITRPSQGSGYVATTTTNQDGEFTVNKVVWETKDSRFGKTADVSRLYLIFYHEDYDPEVSEATVISGSANSSNVYVELDTNRDYTTITLTIYDVSSSNVMTEDCTLEYWVGDSADSDTVAVTGNATIQISFAKDSSPDVKFKLSRTGSKWRMTDRDGAVITERMVNDVEAGTLAVDLYMKNHEFTMPAFSGRIDQSVTVYPNPVNSNDNLPVWLEYKDTDGDWHIFPDSRDANHKTTNVSNGVGDNIYYNHGVFSGVGNGDYTIIVNKDSYPLIFDWDNYNGKKIYVALRLAFKMEDATLKYHEFVYSSTTSPEMGYIALAVGDAAVD